jgi:hypothetical protein
LKKWERSLLPKFSVGMRKLRVVSEQHTMELQEAQPEGIKEKRKS